VQNGFVLFDIVYEDGVQSSNRRVPASELGGLDGDAPAYAIIEMQDRKVSEMSGIPPRQIKSIKRVRKTAKPDTPTVDKKRYGN
jgi:hypothetical protein